MRELILELKALKNTVILVEHAVELISLADQVIEMGPGAGLHGGQVVFQGSFSELKVSATITGRWLRGSKMPPPLKKKGKSYLTLTPFKKALKIPLSCIAAITGRSGSGKQLLNLIAANVSHALNGETPHFPISFNKERIQRVVSIDQKSLRLQNRSIPATYLGIMTPLRELYASTRLASLRGYSAERFSLNKKGGRCDHCQGLGEIKLQLELLPDVSTPCDACQGMRYHFETLQVTFKGLSIGQVLHLTASEGKELFSSLPAIRTPLELMEEVGLGYLTLGQKGSSLSGGEAQRLKLVADLLTSSQKTLYLIDEPTRGLHLEDQKKLALTLQKLALQDHSILMVEHRQEMLSVADWALEF